MNDPKHPSQPQPGESAPADAPRRGRSGEGAASALEQLISEDEQRRRTTTDPSGRGPAT